MYLFFFHINRYGQTILDPEGTRLAGADDARREATLSAREVTIEDLKSGKAFAPDDSIDVADENGLVLFTVTFEQALGLPAAG